MHDEKVERAARRHNRWLAIGLIFLSPLVGEYLLGNTPITELSGILLFATMYGCGALLIREVARRTGGWPTMLVLAAAYALVEEGPIDQMLFNPAYLGLESFVGFANIPGLDLSAWLIQDTLTLHTVWSICVPIAIIETFSRDRTAPLLGNIGLAVVGAVFVAGSVSLAYFQYLHFRFLASPAQFVGSGVVIVTLIAVAVLVGRRPTPRLKSTAPQPWIVGLAAFAASSIYWLKNFIPNDVMSAWVEWALVGWWFVLVGVTVALFGHWSRRRGWDARHRLAVAGGALLTYVWAGFLQGRYLDVSPTVAVLGNLVFGLAGVALLAAAARSVMRQQNAVSQLVPSDGPGSR